MCRPLPCVDGEVVEPYCAAIFDMRMVSATVSTLIRIDCCRKSSSAGLRSELKQSAARGAGRLVTKMVRHWPSCTTVRCWSYPNAA